jgi:small ubiquitin-related modifier
MADEKKSDEHINLKVTGQDGSVVHFKIKKMTPLRKLMSAYCERTGVKMGSMRFRFDGQPINETDTPSQLDMEDGDAIDVFQQQTGGKFSLLPPTSDHGSVEQQ